MKKNLFTISIVVILFLSGCIPSLHPLYFDKDRITLDIIEGSWMSDSGDGWEFIKVENEPSYVLKYTEKQQKGEQNQKSKFANFEANIVQLGGQYFIDLYPGDNQYLEEMNNFLAIHLIQAHTFLKLEIKNKQLVIYQMSPEWLDDLFKENRIRISHEKDDEDKIILTASTKELQKFITKYANDKDAFEEPEVLTLIN